MMEKGAFALGRVGGAFALSVAAVGLFLAIEPTHPQAGEQVARQQTEPVVGSLAELLDLRSASRLKTWRTRQASGYDRAGGFYDSGNFLRVENGRRFVLMETEGAGCIDRMWFTYKKRIGEEPYDLLIYLDNPDKPAIHVDLDELFLGKHPPFVEPLAGLCGNKLHPGRYSYVPIGFQQSCEVVLVPTAPKEQYNYRTNKSGKRIPHIYYQITYRRCPSQTRVRRFRWDLDRAEREALARVCAVWRKAGSSPWTSLEDLQTTSVALETAPAGTTELFALDGEGVIYGLRLRADSVSDLALEITWDKSEQPQVICPIAPFFGSADPHAPVRSLWLASGNGRYACYFPMPFRHGARIAIRSQRDGAVRIQASLQYRRERPLPDDATFHVRRYDYTSLPDGEDYVVLDVEGKGHFAGLVMDHPGHMEGDDRFYVDGETEPSIHGTGTEDFFNFAWGLSHVGSYPLHGITKSSGGQPTCYRFHLPAAVPFQRSLRLTWEHGHFLGGARQGPNMHKGRYSGVVYYYAAGARP